MALELQPGEQVFFPAPYVPTEQHAAIITSKRVVRYAAQGPFPVGEFTLDKIEFIGRLSERPTLLWAGIAAALGLLLFIVGAAKVLPPALHAGSLKAAGDKKDGAPADKPQEIEGRDKDDDYPFDTGEPKKKSIKERAESLQQLSTFRPGIPPLTDDVKAGLFYLLFAAALGYGAYRLYKRQKHYIMITAEGLVHRLEVPDATQQNTVLITLQAIHPNK